MKRTITTIIIYLLLVYGLAMLTSCGGNIDTVANNTDLQKPVLRRVHVLENGSVSYVIIRPGLDSVYRCYDTVWVNLNTHRIDDTDSTTMLCILQK